MKSSWISVRAVLEAAEMCGVDRDELRRRAGIDASDTHDAYGWADGAVYDRVLCSAVELSGSPLFGLSWGESSPMVQFELIPLLVANAPTLRRCIETTLSVQTLLHERPQMSFEVAGGQAVLRVTPDSELSPVASRVIADLSMSGCKRLLTYYARADLRASFFFAYDPAGHPERYRATFGSQTQFMQARSEVVFPSDQLDLERSEHNGELFMALSKHVEALHTRMAAKLTYSERVKAELRYGLPRLLEMAEVAHALGMGARSLRRRLAEENTSFSELIEDSQRELATERLSDPRASVKQVAHELGFDTTSGFHRAFKRWTGQSPAAFRRGSGHGSTGG